MVKNLKINEIFSSIQGEGKFTGTPCLFIRLSDCTRKCKFCDSSYHTNGLLFSVSKVVERINESKLSTVVFTGGEPLLQIKQMFEVISRCGDKEFHLETNGDLIRNKGPITQGVLEHMFKYVCVSPKDIKVFENVHVNEKVDIKVVTDLRLNKDFIPYASILMPLTTFNETKDRHIEQKVWNYCVENDIKFSLRTHIHVWGKSRGV